MASYLPSSFTTPIGQTTNFLRSSIGSISWGPILALSKTTISSLLSRIETGTLVITDQTSGSSTSYGQKTVLPNLGGLGNGRGTSVELTVKKEAFWVRMFLFADMGFAESYMLGEVECNNLTGFFEVGSAILRSPNDWKSSLP